MSLTPNRRSIQLKNLLVSQVENLPHFVAILLLNLHLPSCIILVVS